MSKGLLITEGKKTTIMFTLTDQFLPVGGYPDLKVRLNDGNLVVIDGMTACRRLAELTVKSPVTIRGKNQFAHVTVIDIGHNIQF